MKSKCEVLLIDYRELPLDEPFDKIASVGMFEHVGVAHLPKYFRFAWDLLYEGGIMLNHGICSTELNHLNIAHGKTGDFIERHVFPLSELPHMSEVAKVMSEQGFELFDMESLRPHYALTLTQWVSQLEREKEAACKLVGEVRYRTWVAYLAGSAYGFEQGWMSVYQLLGVKRSADHLWNLPLTREHLYT